MIVVALFGGLGNQMFQYACGKALANSLGVELQLDLTYFSSKNEGVTKRGYELDVFCISDPVASVATVSSFVPSLWHCAKWKLALYKLVRFINGKHYYYEKKKFSYDSLVSSLSDNTYLYGYFQTENYFCGIRNELLGAFSLSTNIDSRNKSLIDNMKGENSVSVHVRRGDYHGSPFTLLDLDYYRRSIEYIKLKVENPVFYVFSNDMSWVSSSFTDLDIEFIPVEHNVADKSFLDMVLMSNCKHNVIANSSFSWWAAWLNRNADKIVIAPQEWICDKNYAESTEALIPDSWIKL